MRTGHVDTSAIVSKISSPAISSLLSIHPNDATLLSWEVSSQWSPWWAWALSYPLAHPGRAPAWLELMYYFTRAHDEDGANVDIPPQLRSLVDSVRSLQLQRTPSASGTHNTGGRTYRMSPKKEHEVDRMSSYIRQLVHSGTPRSVWHAVDIGSGHGYLSRALQELDFHVLALDNDENRTSGASRLTAKEAARKSNKENKMNPYGARNLSNDPLTGSTKQEDPQHHDSRSQSSVGTRKGSITHQTVHVCPRTLEESITGWLQIDPPGIQRPDVLNAHYSPSRQEPVPVLFVALHGCGSLTVDVMRNFLSNRARASQAKEGERVWTPHSLVVVGCCYNLMAPSGKRSNVAIHAKYKRAKTADFPLSKSLRDMNPIPNLTVAAVHLAAQVPSQWLRSSDTKRSAELALRKVVYRALLQPVLQMTATQLNVTTDHAASPGRPIQSGLGETPENRRLGKLNDKAYRDWPTFLEHAVDKLSIDLTAIYATLPDWFMHEATRLKMESALFVLQTLRCIMGPLIETLILLDRRDWLQQELAEMNDCGQEVEVEIINLFDQSTGSGRNVALVVKPVAVP